MCSGRRCEQLSARLGCWESHCDNLNMFWMLNFKGNKSQLQPHLGSAQAAQQLGLGLQEQQRKQRCPNPEHREALRVILDEGVDPTTPGFRCSWLLLREKAKPFHPLGSSGLSLWLINPSRRENTGNALNFIQSKDGTQCQRHCQEDLFLLEGSEGHFSF